jgi:hypothetical protein
MSILKLLCLRRPGALLKNAQRIPWTPQNFSYRFKHPIMLYRDISHWDHSLSFLLRVSLCNFVAKIRISFEHGLTGPGL